jgi:hypothetical protein
MVDWLATWAENRPASKTASAVSSAGMHRRLAVIARAQIAAAVSPDRMTTRGPWRSAAAPATRVAATPSRPASEYTPIRAEDRSAGGLARVSDRPTQMMLKAKNHRDPATADVRSWRLDRSRPGSDLMTVR